MNRFLRREQLLARRRALLLSDSAHARAQLRLAVAGVDEGLESARRIYRVGQWLNANRVFVGVGLLLMFASRRTRGVARIAARGWTLWRGWRALSR